jgi:hypothetical protein
VQVFEPNLALRPHTSVQSLPIGGAASQARTARNVAANAWSVALALVSAVFSQACRWTHVVRRTRPRASTAVAVVLA